MGGSFLRCGITLPSSVAVRDLDIMRVPFAPGKTDPPAVADPNAVLAGPVAFQRLQPVAPDGRKVGQTRGCILRLPNPSWIALVSWHRNERIIHVKCTTCGVLGQLRQIRVAHGRTVAVVS